MCPGTALGFFWALGGSCTAFDTWNESNVILQLPRSDESSIDFPQTWGNWPCVSQTNMVQVTRNGAYVLLIGRCMAQKLLVVPFCSFVLLCLGTIAHTFARMFHD